jgi:hypothetical protein
MRLRERGEGRGRGERGERRGERGGERGEGSRIHVRAVLVHP